MQNIVDRIWRPLTAPSLRPKKVPVFKAGYSLKSFRISRSPMPRKKLTHRGKTLVRLANPGATPSFERAWARRRNFAQ